METALPEFISQNYYYSLASNNNTSIIDITPLKTSTLASNLQTLYPDGLVYSQLYLRGFELKASIQSIAQFVTPETVEDGFTPSIKANNDLLKAIWTQERREFNVYQKIGIANSYRLKGAVGLPNRLRSGAYYFENLLSILSFDGDSYPLGQDEFIGLSLGSNTWGLLQGNDEILVSANWELRHWVMI